MRSLPKRGSAGDDLITRPVFAATNFPVRESRRTYFLLEPLQLKEREFLAALHDDLGDWDLLALVVVLLDISDTP